MKNIKMKEVNLIYGFNIAEAKNLKELEEIYNQTLFMDIKTNKKKMKHDVIQAISKRLKELKLKKYKINTTSKIK